MFNATCTVARAVGAARTRTRNKAPYLLPILLLCALAAAPAGAQQARYSVDHVLDHASASAGALSPDGRWLVVSTAALRDRIGTDNHRFADPTYVGPSVAHVAVVDTRDGSVQPVFPDKRQVRSLAWSPDGARLAFLQRDGDVFRPAVWERASRRLRTLATPPGTFAAENTALQWSEDGTQLYLATRTEQWRRDARSRFEREVRGPIVVMSSSDPFLSWDEVRRWPLRQALAVIDVASGRARQVLPDTLLRAWDVTDGQLRYHVDVTTKTDYETIGGSESRVYVRPLSGGEPRVLIATTRGISPTWSGDGRSYVFTRENRIWMATLADSTPRLLAGPVPGTPPPADSAARAEAARERLSTVRLSHDGSALIASNRAGLWLLDTRTGEREMFHAAPGAEADSLTAPRFSVVEWSRDGNAIFLTYSARDRWERGLFRYDRSTRQMRELVRDSRRYAGWLLSEDGSTLVFTLAEGALPADIHAADADFSSVRRLTNTSAALAGLQRSRAQLVDYLDADGNRLHGVLHYPVDYVEGRRYPTIFVVYETFFDEGFNSTVALLTAKGYAVMMPSVRLETGFPGEAWLKGVTGAANRLIEMGIADGDRLGVHGTSYGGYATNLLITQTNRFKAAINISGKVNMISFYTDSPRLGVRNIHAPERSQDRIGATLWEQPQKYIAHSAIMFADRIRTPLLLITGQQDHNVPERTTMEMFYALRRLGRDVEWVSYINGGHGMPTSTANEVIDYHQRILAWYDRWLSTEPVTAAQD